MTGRNSKTYSNTSYKSTKLILNLQGTVKAKANDTEFKWAKKHSRQPKMSLLLTFPRKAYLISQKCRCLISASSDLALHAH
jgi:hypothetical protein